MKRGFESVRTWAVTIIMVAWLMLLMACGAAVVPTPSSTETPVPSTSAPLLTATPTTPAEPTPARGLPTPGQVQAPAEVLESVRAAAATVAEVQKDRVVIVEATPTEFPSTALGCPDPGKMYAEVIVPGYVVIAEAGGERYQFHTDADGSQVIRCGEPSKGDRKMETPTTPAGEPLIRSATELVSRETGLAASELTLVSAEAVEWPDTSLGCPQPGMMYAQVITPGFRLLFQGPGGDMFEVHTNRSGSSMVLCPAGEETSRDVGNGTPGLGAGAPAAQTREAALKAVARASGLAVDQLEIVEWEAVNWRDSSLGCPRPGANYLMVITPGYRFMVRAGITLYEVHTDERSHAVICGTVNQ